MIPMLLALLETWIPSSHESVHGTLSLYIQSLPHGLTQISIGMRPNAVGSLEVRGRKSLPDWIPGPTPTGIGAARNAHVMDHIGMILLRPFAIFLWTPKTVLASDNTLTRNAGKLGDVVGVRARNDGVEPAEVDSDLCVCCSKAS